MSEGTDVLLTKTSATQDSDYWLEEKRLHVLLYTFNPDEGGTAPLVEYVFDFTSYPPIERRLLRLRTRTTPKELHGLRNVLASQEGAKVNAQRVEVALFQLRNIGVFVPEEVRQLIREHRQSWWNDGAIAESAQSVLRELDIIETAERNVV